MDMEGLRRIVDGPLGFSLRGATYGALLGWLYDKSKEEKEKKKSYHGMSIGAVLGALGGAGYGQFRSDRSHAFDVQELKRKIDTLSGKKAEGTEKHAQAGEMWMMPSDTQKAWAKELSKKPTKEQSDAEEYATASLMRGVGKGAHEALPGLADTFGAVAGLLNGLGHGAWNYFSGSGTFGDGFSRGFSDSADFAKKYYSDPIRYAQMYYGGDKARKALTEWKDFYEKRIMDDVGPAFGPDGKLTDKYRRARNAIGAGNTIGAFASNGTEWGAQALMLGGLLKGIGAASRATSVAPAAASAVGASASTAAPAVGNVGKVLNVMTNPWLVSSVKGVGGALRQEGVNDAMIEKDEEFARKNAKLRSDLMSQAEYWNQRAYESGLTPEERKEAIELSKDFYREAKRYSGMR